MPDFPKTAFILGAGLGTRLRPLTDHCPKPLLPLAGKPMVERALAALYAAGTRRFLINTHHCPEAWTQAFPDGRFGDAEVKLVHEPVLLETGGGLANIAALLGERGDHVVTVRAGRCYRRASETAFEIDPASPGDMARLMAEVRASAIPPVACTVVGKAIVPLHVSVSGVYV